MVAFFVSSTRFCSCSPARLKERGFTEIFWFKIAATGILFTQIRDFIDGFFVELSSISDIIAIACVGSTFPQNVNTVLSSQHVK
jgi:hypothetical protein